MIPPTYGERLRDLRDREAKLTAERERLQQEMDEQILIRLGTRLREARTAADMTQQQVAEEAGLSRSSVANVEAGRQDVSATTLVKLAAAVSGSLAQLLDPHRDDLGQ